MNKLFIGTSVLMFALLASCGMTVNKSGQTSGGVQNGDPSEATVKKNISIGEFSSVSVSQGIDLIFTQGESTGYADIATTPSAEDYLSVKVVKGELIVRYDVPMTKKAKIKGPSIVKVTNQNLTSVSVSSGADFKIPAPFVSEGNLNVSVSSAGDFEAASVSSQNLTVNASSGGDFELKSYSGNLNVAASSGSDVDVDEVKGGNIELSASSGADIEICGIMAGKITANASSGGDISLSGNAKDLVKSASSGGEVNSKKLVVNK